MGSDDVNSKTMILECLDCKETYLADDPCDGYNCPKCNGMVIGMGSLEGAEESIEEMTNIVNKAKHNGLIRKYKRKDKNTRTENISITINFNAEEFSKDLAEELSKAIERQRNSIRSYIQY